MHNNRASLITSFVIDAIRCTLGCVLIIDKVNDFDISDFLRLWDRTVIFITLPLFAISTEGIYKDDKTPFSPC